MKKDHLYIMGRRLLSQGWPEWYRVSVNLNTCFLPHFSENSLLECLSWFDETNQSRVEVTSELALEWSIRTRLFKMVHISAQPNPILLWIYRYHGNHWVGWNYASPCYYHSQYFWSRMMHSIRSDAWFSTCVVGWNVVMQRRSIIQSRELEDELSTSFVLID